MRHKSGWVCICKGVGGGIARACDLCGQGEGWSRWHVSERERVAEHKTYIRSPTSLDFLNAERQVKDKKERQAWLLHELALLRFPGHDAVLVRKGYTIKIRRAQLVPLSQGRKKRAFKLFSDL